MMKARDVSFGVIKCERGSFSLYAAFRFKVGFFVNMA